MKLRQLKVEVGSNAMPEPARKHRGESASLEVRREGDGPRVSTQLDLNQRTLNLWLAGAHPSKKPRGSQRKQTAGTAMLGRLAALHPAFWVTSVPSGSCKTSHRSWTVFETPQLGNQQRDLRGRRIGSSDGTGHCHRAASYMQRSASAGIAELSVQPFDFWTRFIRSCKA